MKHLIPTVFFLLLSLCAMSQGVIHPIIPNTEGNTSKIYKYTPGDGGILYTMTRGNDWAIINQGRVDGDPEHACASQLFNMNTGEHFPVTINGRNIPFAMASNDGNIVVGHYSDRAVSVNRSTGKMTVYPNRPMWHGGHLVDCTPDGRYAVGYYEGYLGKPDDSDIPNDWFYRTLLVDTETGDTIATPGIPQTKRNGARYQSIKFSSISPDGRYIRGEFDWYMEGGGSFIYDRIEDRVVTGSYLSLYHGDVVAKLHAEGKSMDVQSVSGSFVSPGMKAFACRVSKRGADGSNTSCMGVYFPERNELVTYDDMEDGGVSIDAIDDNGTFYGTTDGNMSPLRNFKILYDGKYWVPFNQLCLQRYGYDFYEVTGFERSGTIMGVSPDGHKLISFPDPMGESFCFDFGMTANEACSTLDFLHNVTANPESGAQFELLKSIELTFERPVRIVGTGKNVHLLDSKGNEVATGLSTSSALQFKSGSSTTIIVSFRTRTLAEGEHYTVVIDAGTFATEKSADCMSKEIRLEYVGRKGPVRMVDIKPESGSQLMKLDSQSSYAIVTFDCKVLTTSKANACIEREDGSVAGSLTLVPGYLESTKNQVLLYPSSVINLYDGQRYRLVIAPGSLTDYSGNENSLNERIEVEYTGTYVRPVPTGTVIFQDSWDNISESLNTWLRYDGDHLTPRSTASAWGFDNDNEPWNFSIRESNEAPDYCAASHSMYAPSGQSDDWMMTPQLPLPQKGKITLEFDAQGYGFDCNDVLDVYVYEDSRVLSYLVDANMAVVKSKAVKVFSETVHPGKTMEGLANEWTRYTVDLTPWNGKDIYVAFVNQNRNESAIFVDNVIIQRETAFTMALDYEESCVAKNEQKVSGRITITTDKQISNVTLILRDAKNNEVDKFTSPLPTGEGPGERLFLFSTPLPLTIGAVNDYSIEVQLMPSDGSELITDTYKGSITNLSFKPVKRVVLEEMTGIDCPNCPLGIITIDKLRKMYGDLFIPISLHTYTGDPYATGVIEYSNGLGLNAAPSARINRTKGIYFPMVSKGDVYIDSNADDPLWIDVVKKELEQPSICDFNIDATFIDGEKHDVAYTANVNYAINATQQQLSLAFFLLEDKIEDYQQNAFAGISSPLLMEWGTGGTYASDYVYPYQHNDVARAVIGSNYAGTIGLLPTTFLSGETVSATVQQAFPSNIINPDNVHVVGMLINTQTGEVMNAARCNIGNDMNGIKNVVLPSASATIYDTQGRKLSTQPHHGIVIINGKKYVK